MSEPVRIALIGMGSAGQSRHRALAEVPGFTLGGIVSRRAGVGTRSLEEVLADSKTEAVAISTEPVDHPGAVRRALEAGKHVLCDYPLAFTASEASALFALADEKRLMLHPEHIGLLSHAHEIARQTADELGEVIDGQFIFTGDWNERLADEQRSGPFPFLSIPRLLQLADLFGPFTIFDHQWYADARAGRIQLRLRFVHGSGTMVFLEDRRPGQTRTRRMRMRLLRGTFQWPEEPGTEGLFAKDLERFHDEIRFDAIPYVSRPLLMMVLQELERLL
jgi:predicted dehydrogenase